MNTTSNRSSLGFTTSRSLQLTEQALAFLRQLLSLIVVASLSTFPISAQAHDASIDARDWLVIPVFYATNRGFVGKEGVIEYSEEPNGKGLLFGVKNIVVPAPSEAPVDGATQTKMLWGKVSLEPKEKHGPPAIALDQCKIKNGLLDRDRVVTAFKSYMRNSGSQESTLFVHGCCINFDTAMQRAADLAATMHTPVLLYDWVSPRRFRNYLVNGTRADQTMDDFYKFLTKVEKVADSRNIVLVAHSMGNQFLDQAMIRRYAYYAGAASAPPKFSEIVFSNADVDAQTFLNHADQVVANAEKVRVYFNQTDPRLRLSTFVHGGFKRLGSPGDLLPQLSKVDGLQMVDVTAANLGHAMPNWLVADVHRRGNLASSKDFKLSLTPAGYLSLEKIGAPHQEKVETSAKSLNRPQ
jgi:esterase/lipase superfamily enzyme